MQMKMDRRPTLASWPKRIYGWEELPECFLPALEEWRRRGLPPGNVTYIPRINQYAGSPEYATAWLGEEAMLLVDQGGRVEKMSLRTGGAEVIYTVQLLKCTVDAAVTDGRRVSFSYNKTKEDQLMPVLNLLLGNSPELSLRAAHPPADALDRLRKESYAMYNTSVLCYRYGERISDSLWLRGRAYGLGWRKQKPEWFLAKMERGMVCIAAGFYGTQVNFLPWTGFSCAEVGEADFTGPGPRRRTALILNKRDGSALNLPLLPEQRKEAECFVRQLAPGYAR